MLSAPLSAAPGKSAMNLEGYLSRIGFKGTPRADLNTLRALHRAHAETIPYENLDVQLRTPVTRAAPD
ncbi:MAG: arylamine N-acetyltransferase, partial [Amphiplicatus sp.]|nr:arylamine N-acetyltransferase [Amphiplicatus sp.]